MSVGEVIIIDEVFPSLADRAGAVVTVRVELFATPTEQEPLWSEVLPSTPVGAGGSVVLVLGRQVPFGAEVFVRFPRYLAVRVDGVSEPASRRPISGAPVRFAARLADLESTAQLERASDLQRMLVRMPSRLRSLQDGYELLHQKVSSLQLQPRDLEFQTSVAADLAVMRARIQRLEDQVEDLLGAPHGEMHSVLRRLDAIEQGLRAGVAPGGPTDD